MIRVARRSIQKYSLSNKKEMAKKALLFIIIFLTAIVCETSAYQITRYPLDTTAKLRASYGQYRNWDKYITHDGIDLGGGISGSGIRAADISGRERFDKRVRELYRD